MNYLWKLRAYFRQVAGQLVIGSLAGIVMNTAVILPAILLGNAIDKALALERGTATSDDVTLAALLLVAGTLLTEGPRVLKRWWLITANVRMRANLRADALRGALSRPLADLHKTSIGDQMARIVGDVEVLGVGLREFTIETWDTVLFSLSFLVAMLVIDARLTLLALAPVPVAMLIAHASGRWVTARTTRAREANAALTANIQELLSGFRVLRVFGRGAAATGVIETHSRAYAERNLAAARLRLGLPPLYSTLMMSGILIVIWQGGERVVSGAMSVGAFVGYLALFTRFVERGFRIPQLVNSIQSGGAAYARLAPMLAPALTMDGEPRYASFKHGHIAGMGHTQNAQGDNGAGALGVTLSDVTFTYPGATRPALANLSLEIAPGSLVAVTGAVGSGKMRWRVRCSAFIPSHRARCRDPRRKASSVTSRSTRICFRVRCAITFSWQETAVTRRLLRGRCVSRHWTPTLPDFHSAWTPRSANSACAFPAASGSVLGWRGPSRLGHPLEAMHPACWCWTIRFRRSMSRPKRALWRRCAKRSVCDNPRANVQASCCVRSALRPFCWPITSWYSTTAGSRSRERTMR